MNKMENLHGGELIWYVHKKYKIPIENIVSFANLVSPIHSELPEPPKFILKSYCDREYTTIREIISQRYNVDEDNLILTNGSTELIYLVSKIFGKKTQIKIPTYGEYECAVKNYGGKSSFYDDYSPKNATLSFICNPNNPTGKLIRKEELIDILRRYPSNIKIFLDEAYMGLVSQKKLYSMAQEIKNYKNLIVSQTLSKLYGLPSLRLGWGFASKDIINRLIKHKFPMTICNVTIYYAEQFLQDQSYEKRVTHLIEKEKKHLFRELNKISWLEVKDTDVNYFLVKILNELTASDLFKILAKRGIIIRDCSNIRGLDKKHIRIAVKTKEENDLLIEELMEII